MRKPIHRSMYPKRTATEKRNKLAHTFASTITWKIEELT